jgi:hypothetical protein
MWTAEADFHAMPLTTTAPRESLKYTPDGLPHVLVPSRRESNAPEDVSPIQRFR